MILDHVFLNHLILGIYRTSFKESNVFVVQDMYQIIEDTYGHITVNIPYTEWLLINDYWSKNLNILNILSDIIQYIKKIKNVLKPLKSITVEKYQKTFAEY